MTPPNSPPPSVTSYQAAGVNVEAGDAFVSRLKNLAKRPGQEKLQKGAGGYAAVYPITPQRSIALTTDGVGTKVLLAHQFNQHQGIGVDLVAMCANDLICVGATPTLFLDYYATGKLDVEMGCQLIEGIVEGCDQAGMVLVGGETAEMPDVYSGTHYDLAGFALGEMPPESLLTGDQIAPGQTVIGLASSGIHSNGLSLARKVLTDTADLEALLTPTRIYVKPVLDVLRAYSDQVTGLAHITGGGWRNLFRLNAHVGFDMTSPLPISPIFQNILGAGVSKEECFKTFNMGMGLAMIVSGDPSPIVNRLTALGVDAQVVGTVTSQAGRLLVPSHQIDLTHTP